MLQQKKRSAASTDCQFCSMVSKANGEDPIGTATTCDHWLILEVATPWSRNLFKEHPRIQPLVSLLKALVLQHGVKLMVMLIAPDAEYSRPGFSRVLYYRRPARLFSQFEKQEFVIPEAEATPLATALLKHLMQQPNNLSRFEQYQQQTSHIREILVCTHAQVDLACGRFGTPLYRRLRKEYAPASQGQLRVWQTSHIGGHQFAPTLVDLPGGHFWGHLEPEALPGLVWHSGSVTDLRQFYRGWAGSSKFEQIAEREIWMQEGWDWFNYRKASQVVKKHDGGIKKYLYNLLRLLPFKLVKFIVNELSIQDTNWAEVRFEFETPDRSVVRTYDARVECNGKVKSTLNSGKKGGRSSSSRLSSMALLV